MYYKKRQHFLENHPYYASCGTRIHKTLFVQVTALLTICLNKSHSYTKRVLRLPLVTYTTSTLSLLSNIISDDEHSAVLSRKAVTAFYQTRDQQ